MQIIYNGSPGTGKTTRLIEHYLNFKTAVFETKGYFIVPTAEQAERITNLILARKNPLFNSNIVTLDRFIELIAGAKPITSITQQYILKKLLPSLNLQYFLPVQEHLSLYEYLAGLLNEIKIYNAQDLERSGLKQKELKLILNSYNNYLADHQLLDRADLYQLAAQKLSAQKFDFIILDGFTTFNDRQKELLTALFKTTDNFLAAHLALPDYQDTLDFFQQHGLKPELLSENKRTSQPELIFLSENYLKNSPCVKQEKIFSGLEVLTASNRIIEIEQIAREIIKLKTEHNYHWSDFCVILRQIGDYQTLIQEVFDFLEIPVTIHEGLYLHKNTFICWLRQVLRLSLSDYPQEELFPVMQTGFIQFDKTQLAQLELAAQDQMIYSGRQNWLDLSKAISDELNEKLKALFTWLDNLAKIDSYQALKDIIEDLVSTEKIMPHLKSLTGVKELTGSLREISLAYHDLLGLLTELAKLQTTPEAFPQLLESLEYFLTQKIITIKERQGNQVQVYDLLVARQKEYKIVFLANLTAKSIPLQIKEDIFLKDHERSYLKKSYPKQQEEENLFYLGLTRASHKLYLTSAWSELNGGKLEPSPFLKKLLALFPKSALNQTAFDQTAALPALKNCLTSKDLQQALAYHLYQSYTNTELNEFLQKTKELVLIDKLIQKNKDLAEYAEYRKETQKVLGQLQEFGAKSIETLSQCRFAFFVEQILKIADPDEHSLAIPAGEIIHETLNSYYKNGQKIPITKLLENNLKHNQEKLFFLKNCQLKIELNRLSDKLEIFLAKEKAELEKRTYQPADFELSVRKEFNGITIQAKLDRIDRAGTKAIVLDYKTGQLPGIGIAQIEKGLIPQVWLYCLLLASSQELELAGCEYVQVPKNIRKGIYLEAEKENLNKARSRNILSAEKMQDLLKLTKKFLLNYLAEIKAGQFYVKPEQCLEYCAFGNICRQK